MEFLESWFELTLFDLLRLLTPAGLLLVSMLLPSTHVARLAALGVAVTIPFVGELGVTPRLAIAWSALWLLIAWGTRGREGIARRPLATTQAVVESGTVGLLLWLALTALMVAAVARQDLSPEEARRASYGVVLLMLGLGDLMLHANVRRAALAFGSLGLGLQVLENAARDAQVIDTIEPGGAVLLATVLAVALAVRVAISRERLAGTAWVSDAHDLHD